MSWLRARSRRCTLSTALSEHEWRTLLASPRENKPATPEQAAEQTKWAHDYAQRRAEAAKSGKPAPVEFAAGTATHDWAAKIAEDWHAAVDKFKAIGGLTEDQKQRADKALETRLSELADFVAGAEEDITDYRHELWRLAEWRKSPEAGGVPFYAQRIAAKNSETSSKAAGWREQVRTFDEGLSHDLSEILTPEQRVETRDGCPGRRGDGGCPSAQFGHGKCRGDGRDDQRRSLPASGLFHAIGVARGGFVPVRRGRVAAVLD